MVTQDPSEEVKCSSVHSLSFLPRADPLMGGPRILSFLQGFIKDTDLQSFQLGVSDSVCLQWGFEVCIRGNIFRQFWF